MIWNTVETARLRALFPQKPLQFLRIQAVWDLEQVHDTDRRRGQKPTFTQDLDARVLVEGQSPTRFARHQ
jgi:hypothetical protein